MPAISRYLFSSSFLAEDAMAIRSPASRARCSKSGTAENGRTNERYLLLNRSLRHFSNSSPWSFRCGVQEGGNELVSALTYLASGLFEADVVAELHHRFVPGDRMKVHRVQESAV